MEPCGSAHPRKALPPGRQRNVDNSVFEAFLGYVVGLRLLLAGIKLLGSVSASALNTLEPAFASLTSMAVFGEAMGLLKGCGVILVLAAAVIGILTLNREDSKTRSKA